MTANTIATYPDEIDVQYERPEPDEVIRLLLDGMEQEREMLIGRLRFVESTLLVYGRISQKHVKVRAR